MNIPRKKVYEFIVLHKHIRVKLLFLFVKSVLYNCISGASVFKNMDLGKEVEIL